MVPSPWTHAPGLSFFGHLFGNQLFGGKTAAALVRLSRHVLRWTRSWGRSYDLLSANCRKLHAPFARVPHELIFARSTLPPDLASRLDPICDRFEEA